MRQKLVFFLSLAVVSLMIGLVAFGLVINIVIAPVGQIAEIASGQQKKIVFVFGGDVMLGRMINWELKQLGDYSVPFQRIKTVWQNAEVVMVNLESPLVEDCPVKPSRTMTFCAEPQFARVLKDAGVTHVSFANNHYFDYGRIGFEQTNKYLRDQGIEVINHGQELIQEIQGERIGFLSWNLTWNSVSENVLQSAVFSLRPRVDFLVVNFHWGEEYKDQPNEYQKKLARLLIDSGADLVIGHHPHHIQAVEKYKGSLIFYSLGNLIFDQMWSEKTRLGMLAKITLYPETHRISYEVIKTKINNWIEIEREE